MLEEADLSAKHEVGKQAVGAPADLAANSLHADAVDHQARASLPLVGAPADQHTDRTTVRADAGDEAKDPREWDGLGVMLGTIGVVKSTLCANGRQYAGVFRIGRIGKKVPCIWQARESEELTRTSCIGL